MLLTAARPQPDLSQAGREGRCAGGRLVLPTTPQTLSGIFSAGERERERERESGCCLPDAWLPTYIPTYLCVDALPVQIDGSQSGVCPSVQRCVGRALARGGWRAGCMACADYHTHTPHHAGTDTSGVGGGGM